MLLADNAAALRAFALDGLGIAVLPDWLVQADLRCGALQRLLADHGFPLQGVHAVYPPTRHLPSKVRAFIDFSRLAWGTRTPEAAAVARGGSRQTWLSLCTRRAPARIDVADHRWQLGDGLDQGDANLRTSVRYASARAPAPAGSALYCS